jgi:moderate conductance mechanosensitive channel
MVARTLPGKQFEVGRALRARIVQAFREQGLNVPTPMSADGPVAESELAREGER